MWYILILILTHSSCADSISSATQSSRHKRDDESEPWTTPVLPNTIEPIQYDLFIIPYYMDMLGTSFSGNVSIEINVLNQTKTFIVHAKHLEIVDWRVLEMDGSEIDLDRHFSWMKNDYFVMQTKAFVQGRVRLTYVFHGNMTLVTGSVLKRSGLYNIPYVKENREQSWLVFSDFEQGKARCVFPNFDEPRFKARFRIRIQHWITYTALSNMPVEEYTNRDHAVHVTVFKLSPKMSSRQLSFAVTNFSFKNKTVDEKQLFVWSRPDRLEDANYTLEVTPTIQRYLREQLDMPYSLEKLDQLAVIGNLVPSQRDNWGLNTYRESTLLFGEATGGEHSRYEALKRIAHALSHSYFGNLVTCRYWEHLWLEVGLTTFYEIKALTKVDPTLSHKEFFFGKKVEESMFADAKNLLGPLILPSDPSRTAQPSFDSVDGDKGAAILRMLENVVSTTTFKRGIREYLKQNEYGTAVTDDLWSALQQKVGECDDVKKIMMSWVEKSGFPMIKVELLPGNRINATQKQFLDDPPSTPDQMQKWFVPLTYQTKGRIEKLVWMNETDVVFDIHPLSSDDWIEFNCDRTGYYRVNYDTELWNRLAQQLNEDHTVFTELSRSKLLSDAVALVNAEELGYDVFLNLTRYASKESDLTPWFNIFDGLYQLNRIFNTTSYCSFQNYISNLTCSLMEKLQVRDGGNYIEKQLRPKIMLLACSSGHEGCIENTTREFRARIENNNARTDTTTLREYLREVYCTGIANSMEESLWNRTVERYKSTTSAIERADLLRALSCTRNVILLERLLNYSLDSNFISDRKCNIIIYHVATNPFSDNCAWRWLKNNHAEIDRIKGGGFAGKLLQYAVGNFDTPELYQEVLDFYTVYPDVPESDKQLVEYKINSNIHWMQRNFDAIARWLEQNAWS